MKRLEELPPAFEQYEKMLGVLDFAVFANSTGVEEEIISAIPQALDPSHTFDAERLRLLGCRRIRERTFFGDWYDPDSGNLLKVGNWRTADRTELENPTLKSLDGVRVVSGAAPCPEAGAEGQFAYAFSTPPYGLNARPGEVQAVFEAIRDFVLPPGRRSEIRDWSSPRLPEVSDYFSAGMEWWGVFLFSVYIPEIERLTIVAGSATD